MDTTSTEVFSITPEQDEYLRSMISKVWPKLRDPEARRLDILRYRECSLVVPWYRECDQRDGLDYWIKRSGVWTDED